MKGEVEACFQSWRESDLPHCWRHGPVDRGSSQAGKLAAPLMGRVQSVETGQN